MDRFSATATSTVGSRLRVTFVMLNAELKTLTDSYEMLDKMRTRMGHRYSIRMMLFAIACAAICFRFIPRQSPEVRLIWNRLGFEVEELDKSQMSDLNRSGLFNFLNAVALTSLDSNGAASDAGLQSGDILVGIQGWVAQDQETIAEILRSDAFARSQDVRLDFVRAGQTRLARITLATQEN